MTVRLFITPQEFAQIVEKSERTVHRWIATGTIESVKIGGSRLIPIASAAMRLGLEPGDLKTAKKREEHKAVGKAYPK